MLSRFAMVVQWFRPEFLITFLGAWALLWLGRRFPDFASLAFGASIAWVILTVGFFRRREISALDRTRPDSKLPL
jgi:hypothetical protein